MDQGTVTLLLQILGGLLVLFMLVATYFNTKSWRWHHVTLCFLVFAASIAATVYAAYTIRTHNAWRSLARTYVLEYDKVKAAGDYLEYGSDDPAKAALDNVRHVHRELDRVIQTERGRVWRKCTVLAATPTSVDLEIVGPKTEGIPDDNILALGFDKNDAKRLVLQAFTETQADLTLLYPTLLANVGGALAQLPDVYVGEYVVDNLTSTVIPAGAAADGTATPASLKVNLTLKPRMPLDQRQTDALTDKSKTWTLYESMPIDMHEVFTELNSTEEGKSRFTELFEAKRFPRNLPPEKYEALKAQFKRDGQAATEMDPPARVWMKVELLEPTEFDVDAEAVNATGDRFFDSTGRASDPFLRLTIPPSAGGAPGVRKATFAKGDTLLLQKEDAEKLVSSGKAKNVEIELSPDLKVASIYVRELRDYGILYHRLTARGVEADNLMAQFNIDTVRLNEAADDLKKQIAVREEEKTKFTEDKQHVERDRDAIKNYLAELTKQRDTLLGDCATAFKTNLALAAELKNVQKGIADKINAGGPAPPAASPVAPSVPAGPATN